MKNNDKIPRQGKSTAHRLLSTIEKRIRYIDKQKDDL